jgi:hypothetical protein
MPQLAIVPEHGQRLGKAERPGVQAPDTRRHLPGEPGAAVRWRLTGVELGDWVAAAPACSQQLVQIEGVAAAFPPRGSAQLVSHLAARQAPHDRSGRAFAQQGRAHHRRLGAYGQQRRFVGRRLSRTQCDQQAEPQAFHPRCKVGQPAKRRRVSPVRVVHRDEERPGGGEVCGYPVEAVQYRERDVAGGALDKLARQERPRGGGRAREQRLAFGRVSDRDPPLEELAHHAESESRLQF